MATYLIMKLCPFMLFCFILQVFFFFFRSWVNGGVYVYMYCTIPCNLALCQYIHPASLRFNKHMGRMESSTFLSCFQLPLTVHCISELPKRRAPCDGPLPVIPSPVLPRIHPPFPANKSRSQLSQRWQLETLLGCCPPALPVHRSQDAWCTIKHPGHSTANNRP